MKKILLFAGFKTAEAMGMAGILYWFYWSGNTFNIWRDASFMEKWWEHILTGLMLHVAVLWVCLVMFAVMSGFYHLWNKNWEWVNKILNK